ncbi:ankyrin repeat domain-containing protein [Mycobacterium sp. TNTM28]|uniref:Ankyrin repeat domain-containing protein n=1 Tax=[Mycobacterium] fortunisiensis TaxID=2600579 RepID=A0ABS6KTG6_9MYCO|nr:ankyrin repeat domain-containing protein [[Mycobacterium] fortunisiensis]MBU9766950.1 ankyrin repeat domain-containing protein [[Mycobacterium] fortunisiensis]
MTNNDRDEGGRTPLHYAAIDAPSDLPFIAAQTDAALDEENWRKANEYKVSNVSRLLAEGADVNAADAQGFTPLLFAAASDSVDVVRLLLDAGADIEAANDKGETPLYKAVRNTTRGAVPITQLLLKRGANPNAQLANGSSPLAFVRRFQKPGIIELFADLP